MGGLRQTSRKTRPEPIKIRIMSKPKFYFKYEDSEFCYSEEYFIGYMQENNVHDIEVYEAIRDRIKGIYWCKEKSFCMDGTLDTCGKENCCEYKPRNRINGICTHLLFTTYKCGDKVILKLNK